MSSPIDHDRHVWNAYWASFANSRCFIEKKLNVVGDQIERGAGRGTLLDIGCGSGYLVQHLCSKGVDARGLDISDVAVSIASRRCSSRFQQGSILSNIYAEKSFDIITCVNVLEFLSEDDILHAISNIARLARCAVYLVIAIKSDDPLVRTTKTREWWEARCFEAGLRRHPNIFSIMPYDLSIAHLSEVTILLEPLPDGLNEVFGLDSLAHERTLHMDMAREAGSRSDAHMMRYHAAAQYIRFGDRVLDAACGLGYGSHILRHQSLCAEVLGVDGSPYAIDYATRNYGEKGKVDFLVGFLPEALESIEPGSIDFIASFETLEHLTDPTMFLAACRKILSPGGRLMVSVPHDWTEADGKDPNPNHFHVYNWQSLCDQVKQFFIIEKAFCQTADRLKRSNRWVEHGREWKEIKPSEASSEESEWCLVLAMVDPVGATQQYFDRHHPRYPDDATPIVLDFAKQYKNPWLVSSLISIGLRTEDADVRLDMAHRLTLSDDTADSAAARCIEGYHLLDTCDTPEKIKNWCRDINPYVFPRNWEAAPPIDIRWAISLLYIRALLQRKIGLIEEATSSLLALTHLPFLLYSPLIATKVVDAYYELGLAAWVAGDGQKARVFFLNGLKAAKTAVTADWDQAFGPLDEMPRFITSELSEILDLSTRCAVGARHALSDRPTGLIAVNVAWNQKFQLSEAKVNLRRLQDELNALNRGTSDYIAEIQAKRQHDISVRDQIIAGFEDAKRTWYDPQLLALENEVTRLNEVARNAEIARSTWYEPRLKELSQEINRLTETARSYEIAKLTWYEPRLNELSREIDRLTGVTRSYDEAISTWYEPQFLSLRLAIERLEDEIKQYRAVKIDWYEPQLESRARRICELEKALVEMQSNCKEIERATSEIHEAEVRNLQGELVFLKDECLRLKREASASLFARIVRFFQLKLK